MNAQRPDARGLVEAVLDPGTWRSWDEAVADPAGPGSPYAKELAAARARTGYDEAVITGEGRLRGRTVGAVACEFSFLGGSIGVAAANRLVRAIERATARQLPLLAAPASGGTRMQEGAMAFAQMVKISAAIARHRASGLPYLVYLRHPTTGGVFASWGSLGHVTAAEPGALIGFLGPRVYEALYGEAFPPEVQRAENLHRHGLVDAVVAPEDLAEVASRALAVLCAPRTASTGDAGTRTPPPADEVAVDVPAWESVERSRRADRPGVRALLRVAADDVTPLHGTGEGESEPGVLLALARFGRAPCVVLGQDRKGQRSQGPLGPAGLRVARRGMRLADELRLPLVTVIDTGGAALSREAEEGGLAAEIARCLADLAALPTPTVCLMLGEGAGGAALALLPADRVLCAQHAWLSPLPPEGASVILHRTTQRAPEVAAMQRSRSVDLLRDGIVDRVVPEHPDAADEVEPFLHRVARALEYEIAGLLGEDDAGRLTARAQRFRSLGASETVPDRPADRLR